jgi:hypothetical protein
MDPYTYDLKNAIQLIEVYGEKLEDLIALNGAIDGNLNFYLTPNRLDMCECERINRCPNGTVSAIGAKSWIDCYSEGLDVLRRVDVVPAKLRNTTDEVYLKKIANVTDFWELGGADASTLPDGNH